MKEFFQNKRVFITGHTGNLGVTLIKMLQDFDAKIFGFALPSNFKPIKNVTSIFGDIKDRDALETALELSEPEIIFHLATKNPLNSKNPTEILKTNYVGTLNILELASVYQNLISIVILANDESLLSLNNFGFFSKEAVNISFAQTTQAIDVLNACVENKNFDINSTIGRQQ